MAKERKCKKCGLSYKGMKTECPFCHKRTKFGIINKIMTVIGYITTITLVSFFLWYEISKLVLMSFALVPMLFLIIYIAIIITVIVLIFK